MNEPSLIARQRTLLADLDRLTAERGRLEPSLARGYRAERERADREFRDSGTALRLRHQRDKESLDITLEETRQELDSACEAECELAQKEHGRLRMERINQLDGEKEAIDNAFQEATWNADAVLEGARTDAGTQLRDDSARVSAWMVEVGTLREEARDLLRLWKQPIPKLEEQAAREAAAQQRPLRKLSECIDEAREQLEELESLVVPRYLRGGVFWLAFVLGLVLIVPMGGLVRWYFQLDIDWRLAPLYGAPVGLGIAALVGVIAQIVLRLIARRQIAEAYLPLCLAVLDAEATRVKALERYQAEHDAALAAAQKQHELDRAKAYSRQQQKLADLAGRRASSLGVLESQAKTRKNTAAHNRALSLAEAEKSHQQGHARFDQQFLVDQHQLEARHRARVEEIDARHLQQWHGVVEKWQSQLAGILQTAREVHAQSEKLFPRWHDPSWQSWQPPRLDPAKPPLPAVMRVGSYSLETTSIVDVPPWNEDRPEPTTTVMRLPAFCTFPEPSSLLFHARDEGRERAVEALQTLMLRLLTTLPPGRVRFLIVDPVGLGQNFAGFMHLADHDEALVGGRIWTEAGQIEHRLADLTAHMENVIQKYLRNRYATITEYNAQAGEVAEPYRVLVIANFPVNFTAEATRRLVSIAQSGPRCGVSTLLSIDGRQPMPDGFSLADLERSGISLDWKDEHFRLRDRDFGRFPLQAEPLPPGGMEGDFCNRLLHQVGEGARNARRVEVPFEFIAPGADSWWTGSTSTGISVPIGRAGATRRQLLELGKGTSQHVLIAGKTGSGKSTLMHAIITNLALLYGPDEIELHLVDFKKGVEFKTYAAHELPHARVVAIESEREFGLSVLERLDTELKQRGERFRAAGAQDLNGYRQTPQGRESRSPRILLVVDEFQEFFIEDDRIARDAAQLLDRLVRQGRAFGMHVLLGSQTLGGAYSLARSTIDQMAVRIALQCSEADAHLILSDENSAARLLSRPGEAIYNDHGGLVEGNDPFQVVWLGEEQREQYLNQIQKLAKERPARPRAPMVVFEGNASADVTRNPLLEQVLSGADSSRTGDEHGWLGEAMAIDELTSAVFRKQNGSNLLIVGQQPEAALGMVLTATISLAARAQPAQTPRITIVDGNQALAPHEGPLAELAPLLPGLVKVTGWRELPAILAELQADLDRRQAGTDAEGGTRYLVLYGLQRMRDLRRAEDDYGFSSRSDGQPATPDKILANLLREGAVLGIHVLVWCDTMNNLNRVFDRQAMRELSMRVVFQMSVADSSNLIDNPAASKLGVHRALFVNEEDGKLEKFRPYEVLPAGWLARASDLIQQRRPVTQSA